MAARFRGLPHVLTVGAMELEAKLADYQRRLQRLEREMEELKREARARGGLADRAAPPTPLPPPCPSPSLRARLDVHLPGRVRHARGRSSPTCSATAPSPWPAGS